MRRALFFLSSGCGGAERMTITIAKFLDRSLYDVHFVVVGREIGEIKSFIPDGYPLHLIKIRNIFDFTTLRIYLLLKELKPQYVFCSLHYLNPRVIQAAQWIRECKAIVRLNCAVNRLVGINKMLTQLTYPQADTIICQTETMQQELITACHLSRDKVIALHNLIDKDTIESKLKDAVNPYKTEIRKVFVWVGRYDPVKGAINLVEAFYKASKKIDDICLYLVGKIDENNDYFQTVKQFVACNGLEDKVIFAGFQNNPYQWMKYANCFVLSSMSEGSPNALFESLYLGVPSVTTRCTPNIDDIIIDGINGYKVQVGDTDALAECMIAALQMKAVKSIYNHSKSDDFIRLFR